ncbi:MAG: GNAT family N-acetyltransferase [Chloroflexi bacterium]|nr:GNAT family N-acetyltransferase [Chloroflexota bacterium]
MSIEIVRLAPNEIGAQSKALADIYRAVFTIPPYRETENNALMFPARVARHSSKPGFQCLIARDTASEKIIGMAYGYAGHSDDWWFVQIARVLASPNDLRWLDDCFHLAELAVVPEWQGQGIGGTLHDALLREVTQCRALLSTAQSEGRAMQLYRARGWGVLCENFTFPGTAVEYVVMVCELKNLKLTRRSV